MECKKLMDKERKRQAKEAKARRRARNAAAKALAGPEYRPRVVAPRKGRKSYSRKREEQPTWQSE
jgi:stalled ribosome alternative rescue factor ArfA